MKITYHATKNRVIISAPDDSIQVKLKHLPIFLMMIYKHYGKFSEGESFGKYEVVKRGNFLDTVVVKKGKPDSGSKYAIGTYDDGDRLYGLDFEDYIVVNEDIATQLVLELADCYIDKMNAIHDKV